MRSRHIPRATWRSGICRRVVVLLLSGLSIFVPAPALLAQDLTGAPPSEADRFAAHIAEASQRFGMPVDWIRAVLAAESAEDIGAVAEAGAMGLMQVMPDTWDELRARHSLGDDPFDPRDNILAGAAYLREMLDRYGNVGAMLAAYNAGPTRYDEYIAGGRSLPAETQAYVATLAPILGDEPLPEDAIVTSDSPVDWRDAPLFVGLATATAEDETAQGDSQPAVDRAADALHPDRSHAQSDNGIFVPTSDQTPFQ